MADLVEEDMVMKSGAFKCPGCGDRFWTEEYLDIHFSNNEFCKITANSSLIKEGLCPLGVKETVDV